MRERRLYLVSYDIANPKRWRRVFKLLQRNGEHLQLSVFLCRIAPARMLGLQARLMHLIDTAEDRLLVVELGNMATASGRIGSTGAIASLEAARPVVL